MVLDLNSDFLCSVVVLRHVPAKKQSIVRSQPSNSDPTPYSCFFFYFLKKRPEQGVGSEQIHFPREASQEVQVLGTQERSKVAPWRLPRSSHRGTSADPEIFPDAKRSLWGSSV